MRIKPQQKKSEELLAKYSMQKTDPLQLNRVNGKVSVCINLMIQVSCIQGHEIRIVLYARLDGGDYQFY